MGKYKLSILELAVVAEGKTATDTFKESAQLAQLAESLGYQRFWLAEHHNMISVASTATTVLISHLAGVTKKIRIGSGGIMLPNHSPFIVAEQFGTLAALYPNRIDMGLGRAPGTDQLTAREIRPDRMTAVHSFPDDVRKIQQYMSVNNAHAPVRAIPAEGANVPIWILGSSTDSAYLAAAMGLPYAFASHFAPTHLAEAVHIYRSRFQPSAQLQQPYVMAGVNVLIADTAAEAAFLATSRTQMMASVISGRPQLLPPPVHDLQLSDAVQNMVNHMLQHSFVGDTVTVQQGLDGFIQEYQVDELMVVTNTYNPAHRLHSFQLLATL